MSLKSSIKSNGNGAFSWSNLIAVLALVVVLFGGGWTLFQAQFSNLEKEIDTIKTYTAREEQTDIAGLSARDNEHEAQILKLFDEIKQLHKEVLGLGEFKQFEQRFDELTKRIAILEATRPTADTLQQATGGLEKRVDVLREDMRQIEARQQDRPTAAAVSAQMTIIGQRIEQLYQLYIELQKVSHTPVK